MKKPTKLLIDAAILMGWTWPIWGIVYLGWPEIFWRFCAGMYLAMMAILAMMSGHKKHYQQPAQSTPNVIEYTAIDADEDSSHRGFEDATPDNGYGSSWTYNEDEHGMGM